MTPSRRSLLAAAGAASYNRVAGANERLQVGFIGCDVAARRHLTDFGNQKDADLAAMCDVYRPRYEQAIADFSPRAKGYQAARRFKRVVQVGTQQRSGLHYRKAAGEILPSGYLGRILSVRVGGFRNVMPGFGRPPDSAPPPGLDYDLWLGPAPRRAYNPNRSLYHFRWFWDYSGGQMTNLAAHEMDTVLWALQAKGPSAVSSSGGRFGCEDNGEVPDTQDALFEFPRSTALFSYREAAAGTGAGSGVEFYGTKGSMRISLAGFQVIPDRKMPPGGAVPVYVGQPAIPANGQHLFEPPKPEPWIELLEAKGTELEQFDLHVRNFIDCVKSRQKSNADV